jgi:hypothetical protein|tara:strand:- start:1393 stop:1761 length:369 start_codon:yes stop_codon:yes gene_type:complete
MSHFSYISTKIQNIQYLKKALLNLDIQFVIQNSPVKLNNSNLVISQNNGYDVEFNWNGKEYELITDLSFWQQKWSVETFMDKLKQTYANETIVNESEKQGFQKIRQSNNNNGEISILFERWK